MLVCYYLDTALCLCELVSYGYCQLRGCKKENISDQTDEHSICWVGIVTRLRGVSILCNIMHILHCLFHLILENLYNLLV